MKNLILTAATILVSSLAIGQKINQTKVPSSVQAALLSQNPNQTKVKWEKEKQNYEASFLVDKVEHSMLIDPLGSILETEVEIPMNQLPAPAVAYIKKNYDAKKIKETAKITNTSKTTTYEAEVASMDLIFDSKGNFIKSIKE